jgi:hypothetical protein
MVVWNDYSGSADSVSVMPGRKFPYERYDLPESARRRLESGIQGISTLCSELAFCVHGTRLRSHLALSIWLPDRVMAMASNDAPPDRYQR